MSNCWWSRENTTDTTWNLLPAPMRKRNIMPVKVGSKLPTENAEARIEIVPLIDIMFFLLASFMLVSLSMVHAMTVKVNLPTATTASADAMKDVVTISIDKSGNAYLDKTPMADNELRRALAAKPN